MAAPENFNEDEEVVRNNLRRFDEAQQVNSDEALLHKSDTSNLSKHNEQYTKLLKVYVKYFELNSEKKHKNKEDIFKITKALLLGVPVCTVVFIFTALILLACGKIDILQTIPELITVLVALISTFMVVPQMITEYLFNKEEENHLAEIIGKIQEYDRDIRGAM